VPEIADTFLWDEDGQGRCGGGADAFGASGGGASDEGLELGEDQDGLRLLEGSHERAADQLLFLKAQIVNWVVAAINGHAKNYSVFLGPGGFAMTPLGSVDGMDAPSRRHHNVPM
jgi:hypothetical protein